MRSTRAIVALLLPLLTLGFTLGCGPDEAEQDPTLEPPLTARALYRLHPGLCLGGCPSYTLYRDDNNVLELRAHTNGEYIGRALADLHPDTAAQLDELSVALAMAIGDGEIQPNTTCPVFHDAPRIELIVADTTLEYDMQCEPDGAQAIDMLLFALLDDLERCRPSARISPKIGCEALSPDDGE